MSVLNAAFNCKSAIESGAPMLETIDAYLKQHGEYIKRSMETNKPLLAVMQDIAAPRPVKTNLTNINEALYLLDQLRRQFSAIGIESAPMRIGINFNLGNLQDQLVALKGAEPEPDLTKML